MYVYTYACVGRQAPVVCGWAWKKHRFARGQRRRDWSERLFLIHAGVLSYMSAHKRLPTPVCSLAHIAGITVESCPCCYVSLLLCMTAAIYDLLLYMTCCHIRLLLYTTAAIYTGQVLPRGGGAERGGAQHPRLPQHRRAPRSVVSHTYMYTYTYIYTYTYTYITHTHIRRGRSCPTRICTHTHIHT